jgi:hypothetical protein
VVPFLAWMSLDGHPNTYLTEGIRRGTATSSSTRPGTTSPTGRWETGTEVGRFLFDDSQTEMDVPVEIRHGVSLPATQTPSTLFPQEIVAQLRGYITTVDASIIQPLSAKYLA